ncbi:MULTISPECIES: AEC family transporter [Methylobacterium]|jgi:malonate transporter|uniref:Transporter n=2 Tax=Methylobacterium TaxID=407 RepID=A0AAE8L820_9HYPH|nr:MULTISPECIES: AEC family transporter [Methylobacterium]AIQ92557.1 Auxin Efflux Carrier [Methylobacterium oryzae CBMB20]APT32949.1 transporter [Methylobacterium phyllosphaerae]AWV15892.1 transporter [Methylobacterium sp. XJLW]MBP32141.1 AEC family transporter [Methylobacterium sp.]MDH3031919.1 AEC family transporter [Methylobacterium fujisawaense]
MLSTVLVVLPIFALIFAGWLARRIGVLGAAATTELNRFVVFLALPALLFDVTAHAHWSAIWKPGFIGAFGLSSLAVFALTVLIRRGEGRPLADAAVDGLNAGYANTGFMGFPLALVAFGPEALAPTTVAAILTVCGVFAVAIVLIETGLRREAAASGRSGPRMPVWRSVGRSLMRNPLLVAPALGALVPSAGLTVPESAETFLKLLGGAAAPCALVALGLFLAQTRHAGGGQGRTAALLVGLKLALHPLLAYGLGRYLFDLPPLLLHTAVLMAALPTGTGPFMLAEFYRREADLTATVVLVSTVLAIVTVSAYLSAIA